MLECYHFNTVTEYRVTYPALESLQSGPRLVLQPGGESPLGLGTEPGGGDGRAHLRLTGSGKWRFYGDGGTYTWFYCRALTCAHTPSPTALS